MSSLRRVKPAESGELPSLLTRGKIDVLAQRHQMELVIISLLTTLAVPLVLFTAGIPRMALAILFLLFFPGYVLIAALFPRRDSLDAIERVALSFGLSIAIVSLIGLALDHTSWGIRLNPVVVSTVGFVLITSLAAMYRRQSLPQEARFSIGIHISLPQVHQASKLDRFLAILFVLSILATLGALVYVVVAPKAGERFTEFYVLGSEEIAEKYPEHLVVGQQGEVTLGIVNREQEDMSYLIEVRIDDEEGQETGPIILARDEKWEGKVTFVATRAGEAQRVEFRLYKGDESEPYLDLHLWLDVEEAA